MTCHYNTYEIRNVESKVEALRRDVAELTRAVEKIAEHLVAQTKPAADEDAPDPKFNVI